MIKLILNNLKKDILIENRNRSALTITIVFSIVIVISISLTMKGAKLSSLNLAVLYWLIVFFSATNSLIHIFSKEEDKKTILLLKLNFEPNHIFISKYIFNTLVMLLLIVIITPLFIVFLQFEIKNTTMFILTTFSACLSISSSTTIVACITSKAKSQNSLFSILAFPILLPVLWISITATISTLETEIFNINYILFLLSFACLFLSVSLLLFKDIWECD